MKSGIICRRTFEGEGGTDGVALFEGRIIGRVRLMAELPHDPKPWMWSVTDPDLCHGYGVIAPPAVPSGVKVCSTMLVCPRP
jgi:hypothetical protein